MITFDDPFEAVLSAASDLGAVAYVVFVHRSSLPRLEGMRRWRRAKGATLWPDDGDEPLVMLDAQLRRGVQGTLDILAHELAHVIAGHDAGHGEAWQAAYDAIFEAASDAPVVTRMVGQP